MKATLAGQVLAESDDRVEFGGYEYFPRSAVRMDLLRAADKTDSDLACPHGVRFYDAWVDGVRYPRVAWSYEAPREPLRHIDHRFGFWEDVQLVD